MGAIVSLLPRLLRRLRRLGQSGRFGRGGDLARLAQHSRPGDLLRLVHILERMYGHERSAQKGRPVCDKDEPLPWYTYPAIEYLRQLDLRRKSVFEYGAGFGSWFFAERAERVVSVEHEAAWHAEIAAPDLPNLKVRLCTEKEDYLGAIAKERWDVIAIDGVWRGACAAAALPCLSPTGFIILDNADWYPCTARFLREAGLLQIDFTGFGPVNYYTWTTSLFLRRDVDLTPLSPVQPQPGQGSLKQIAPDDHVG